MKVDKICEKCNQKKIRGEPDPCLGYLPGIAHACCGHGIEAAAYCCGWPDCKPNESCTPPDIDLPKPYFKQNEKGEWDWIIDENYWEQQGTVWVTKHKREGYWVKRGQEAIEYMEKLK